MTVNKLAFLALCAAALPVLASAETLTLTVDTIATPTGTMKIGLYDQDGYQGGAAVSGADIRVEGTSITVMIEGLEPGEYGIKLYHDVDDDGQMDTNPFGIPTEPYGFSNNAKGRFGPASWDAAKFVIGAEGAVHTISLN